MEDTQQDQQPHCKHVHVLGCQAIWSWCCWLSKWPPHVSTVQLWTPIIIEWYPCIEPMKLMMHVCWECYSKCCIFKMSFGHDVECWSKLQLLLRRNHRTHCKQNHLNWLPFVWECFRAWWCCILTDEIGPWFSSHFLVLDGTGRLCKTHSVAMQHTCITNASKIQSHSSFILKNLNPIWTAPSIATWWVIWVTYDSAGTELWFEDYLVK